MNNTDFPRILTLVRKERKISQKKAAADLGISQALLSHYEKGIRECGLEFILKAADYYDVTCDYLLGRSPSPGRQLILSEVRTGVSERIKAVSDSQNIISKLCENSSIDEDVYKYLCVGVYKLLRIVYNSNPENPKKAFKIPAAESEYLCDCLISRACAGIKGKNEKNGVRIAISEIEESFPDSQSLLTLIKLIEDEISAL